MTFSWFSHTFSGLSGDLIMTSSLLPHHFFLSDWLTDCLTEWMQLSCISPDCRQLCISTVFSIAKQMWRSHLYEISGCQEGVQGRCWFFKVPLYYLNPANVSEKVGIVENWHLGYFLHWSKFYKPHCFRKQGNAFTTHLQLKYI